MVGVWRSKSWQPGAARLRTACLWLATASIMGSALAAGQAAAASTAAATDPLTGLPIPLMPGEHYASVEGGCGYVSASPIPADYKPSHRWSGDCRLGLIHGPGHFTNIGPGDAVNRAPMRAIAYMGLAMIVPKRDHSFVGPTPGRDYSERLYLWDIAMPSRVNRAALPADDVWAANGRSSQKNVATYQRHGNLAEMHPYISRQFDVKKNSCPTNPVQLEGLRYRIDIRGQLHDGSYGDLQKGNAQDKRIFDHCQREIAALLGPKRILERGQKLDFARINRGYYFSVSTQVMTCTRDPSYRCSDVKTVRDNRLCPTLTDPVSCEPLIAEMLAPFEADYARLQQLASDYNAAELAKRQAFYAPYLNDWRARVRAAATRL